MEAGEPTAVGVIDSDKKILRAKVVEVTFKSPIKVSNNNATVQPPHWSLDENVNDGPCSKKPAAYMIRGGKGASQDVEVKVEVLESKNVSGNGRLFGVLGGILIQGDCPLSAGPHTVAARIVELPEGITWLRGDMVWGMEVEALGTSVGLGSSRVEVFFILGTPPPYYQNAKGVWAEALRFLCTRAGVPGVSDATDAVARVTRYCHTNHGLHYDAIGGRPAYGCGQRGGRFQLDLYMACVYGVANCYDQAGAVQSLSGALGAKVDWIYLDPYGFINITVLLGWGACNNPFFMDDSDETGGVINLVVNPQILPPNDRLRTAFGNHAFCAFSGKVYDACAGPHLGTESYHEYCQASIDYTTTRYHAAFQPGTELDMQWCAGVTAVV